uniref:NADH dehydrogenase subunit 6 n=1 Tax=Bipalium kewense TaxID=66750 RepID=A0A649UB65_9PLAT|nr:NADH dehydrogenase subunit 6 [Bipalium kewense]QGI24375.1 NADH dehydrogenase subunit 6 [Bipalium kewense]
MFVQFCSSVILLGVIMLSICLIVFFVLSVINLFWYGLIFLLINVGGSMVLFYYMFSLQSNPLSSYSFISKIFFFLVIVFFGGLSFNNQNTNLGLLSFNTSIEDVSFFLFSICESYFLILISIFLIFVLFVVSMMTSVIGGSFRFVNN